jgi:hypothetical protein
MIGLDTFYRLNVGASAARLMALGYDRRVFTAGDQPWVWKGISFFKLGELARLGQWSLIDAILDDFDGFNVVRAFDYVMWTGTGWDSPGADVWFEVLEHLGARGWRLELTLLTDDDPARIDPAERLVTLLSATLPPALLIEIANEPREHKHVDVEALRTVCEESGLPFASGLNAVDEPHFGSYLTHHSPRGTDWQRKGGHDLMEFWTGAGPEAPHAPWLTPAIADEPMRPDQDGYHAENYKAYFASCALLAGGASLHYEGGKFGQRPTPDELRCAKAALEGLDFCTPGTPNNAPGYQRIDEHGKSLRTYTCGGFMVRIPPLTTTEAPEPGWEPIGTDGILWRKP